MNISDVSGVTRGGRVFAVASPKRTEDVVMRNQVKRKILLIRMLIKMKC